MKMPCIFKGEDMDRSSLIIAAIGLFVLCASVASAAQGAGAKPTVLNDIVYARIGDRALHMNLTLPPDAPAKLHPAIIWIHGGGWCGGDHHADPTADFGLNGHGFVTGSMEYRLSQEAKYPAQIQDCKAAIRFLRANAKHYGIDPNRIGVWGGSAGGHLVALLGTTGGINPLEGTEGNLGYSSRVQAVCDLFGPTDFSESGMKGYIPAVVEMIDGLLGGPVNQHKGLARLASPVEFASKDDPPMLILHGDQDPLVPMSQSEELYTALKRMGADVTLVKVKHAGHGFLPAQPSDPSFDQIKKMVLDFFRKSLEVSK
jgi:acetyl esterase/lipase